MDVERPLQVLTRTGCRFMVVGSAARALLGERVEPRDLDIVVDASEPNRAQLIGALVALRGQVEHRRRWVPVADLPVLPWAWGWTARTPFGGIDVVTRFVDGTGFEDHDRLAVPSRLPGGATVRCHPTRRAA